MGDYRDELAAAQARIARLEDDLAKRDPLGELGAKAETNAGRERAPIRRAQRGATSPLGFMTGFGSYVVLAIFIAFGAMNARVPAIAWTCFALSAALGVLILAAHVSVRRSVARERAWLTSLPFPIVDHFEMFGATDGTFTIHFAAEKPAAAAFTHALGGVALGTEFRLQDHIEPFRVELRAIGTGASYRARRSAWRSVVSTLLVPLHERYPIDRITCR
jgi:hypothetical protein